MTTQQTDIEEQQGDSLGVLLHKTRKAQHKTLAEAAAVTRINPLFLQALEQDDYGKLPAEIFIRGFIKIYASYLGLAPEDTFKHYMIQKGISLAHPESYPHPDDIIDTELLDKTSIFKTKKKNKALPVIILLTILLLFYALGLFFRSKDQVSMPPAGPDIASQLPDPVPPVKDIDTIQPPPPVPPAIKPAKSPGSHPRPTAPVQVTEPIASRPSPKPSPATPPASEPGPPATITAVDQPPLTIDTSAALNQPPDKIVSPPPVSLPVTVQVATENNQTPPDNSNSEFAYVLEAQFKESSPVRIKVDDKPQLQYDSQAGIVRVWRAHDSIVLNLDNRPGVVLTLNGQPLPITDIEESSATIYIPADIPDDSRP